ncbi:MAG: arsenate reductase ArsC [Nitrospiraceae bacterium]
MNSLHRPITSQPRRKPGLYRVLFICTGNACRSPMAEGFTRHYGMGRVEAFSAGVLPASLNPRAVRVMAELNIDIANHHHRSVDAVVIDEMDLVVTLCDYAQSCAPGGSSGQHRLHWSIADPSKWWGPDWLVLPAYRKVRDDLDRRIRHLLPAILK